MPGQVSGAEAFCYKRDLPEAQIHILEGGHMALETNFEEELHLVEMFLMEQTNEDT